jgi:hypothetical protein
VETANNQTTDNRQQATSLRTQRTLAAILLGTTGRLASGELLIRFQPSPGEGRADSVRCPQAGFCGLRMLPATIHLSWAPEVKGLRRGSMLAFSMDGK